MRKDVKNIFIFILYIMATPTEYVSGNYSNEDLINIFEPLFNSVGAPTGFVSGNYNKDLSDIFQFRLPFKFLSGSGNNYEGYYLSNGFYILEFYYDINTFTFVPTTNLEIHQLFLVGTGGDGSVSSGGNGGPILNYDTTFNVDPSNEFTINVTTGDNKSSVTNISGEVLNLTTTGLTNGALGGTSTSPNGSDGSQNTYNTLYYGGGGGFGSSGQIQSGIPGGNGGLGGGGGGGGAPDGGEGGNGGGNGIQGGGSGGQPNESVQASSGVSSQYGGGGGAGKGLESYQAGSGGDGGIDGGSGGVVNTGANYGGGGGGGGNYGGGGGGSGTNPGSGGTGCVLLIYKIIG
jgi:hypothetical protein